MPQKFLSLLLAEEQGLWNKPTHTQASRRKKYLQWTEKKKPYSYFLLSAGPH